MIRVARALVVFIITFSVAAACAAVVIGRIGVFAASVTAQRRYIAQCGAEILPPSAAKDRRGTHYFGIIADRAPGTASYTRFVKEAKVEPTIIDYFVKFGAPWDPVPACYAVHQGALPLLQVNLYKQNLASIASGGANNYIVRFADQIKAFGLPVVLSLGHEMNGNWYPWGWKGDKSQGDANTYRRGAGVDPRVFVRFWQKVHQLFAQQKVYNVIWLWTVNRAVKPATDPRAWWPGKQYVDWIGVDGHYRKTSDRFGNVFGPTIASIRQYAHEPILIAESAIAPGPTRPAQIANLYSTVYKDPNLLGVIYFDMKASLNWRLTDQLSITAFAKAVGPYESAITTRAQPRGGSHSS